MNKMVTLKYHHINDKYWKIQFSNIYKLYITKNNVYNIFIRNEYPSYINVFVINETRYTRYLYNAEESYSSTQLFCTCLKTNPHSYRYIYE